MSKWKPVSDITEFEMDDLVEVTTTTRGRVVAVDLDELGVDGYIVIDESGDGSQNNRAYQFSYSEFKRKIEEWSVGDYVVLKDGRKGVYNGFNFTVFSFREGEPVSHHSGSTYLITEAKVIIQNGKLVADSV